MFMNETISIFKALSDPTRLKIALHLASRGELSCQQLSKNFNLSQPTLSHHFGRLMSSGVILERKSGTSHYYRINRELLKKSGMDLQKINL